MIANRHTLYTKYFIILLFELGFGIKFQFIGTISISELFLLLYVPVLLYKVKWETAKDLKNITIAYLLLFTFQALSEYIVENDIGSTLKGLAITVVSYFHFIFLLYYLTKHTSLILAIILSQIAMKLFFGTDIEEQSAEVILEGEAATYLKFYLVPLITLCLLAISIVYKHKTFSLFFVFTGITFIILGARSGGGIILLTGLISHAITYRSLLQNKQRLIVSFIILCLIGYVFYIYYVHQVLAGEITSGNSKQLLICKHPYNPFELLMTGRTETWVGWQAFMDKLWFGHGAWAQDVTGYYRQLIYILHNEFSPLHTPRISTGQIPSHSVLIGTGMMNGIFAFSAMGFIIFYFLKQGIHSILYCEKKYLLILIYYEIMICWTALFSPQSHFRQTLPVAFAIIFILHLQSKKIKYNQFELPPRLIDKIA